MAMNEDDASLALRERLLLDRMIEAVRAEDVKGRFAKETDDRRGLFAVFRSATDGDATGVADSFLDGSRPGEALDAGV